MLAGAGLPFESQEEVDMPCHGCGFTSYGDLFQAVLEWPDFTENLFACRRVNRLKYFTGSQLSFTFKMGQVCITKHTLLPVCPTNGNSAFDVAHSQLASEGLIVIKKLIIPKRVVQCACD